MKRVIKNAIMTSLILVFSFLFIDSAQAKLCKDFALTECTNAVDDNGDTCELYSTGSATTVCRPAKCTAYNNVFYYDPVKDCPTNKCTTSAYTGYCMPKRDIYTCEDFGNHTNLNGYDLCTSDEYGNPCAADENGYCYTSSDEFGDGKLCKDYTSGNCPENDDLGNVCEPDDSTGKCNEVYSQVGANRTYTDAVIRGDDAPAVLEDYKTTTLSSIKKTCALYSVKDCPKKDEYGNECVVAGALGGNKCHRVNIVKSNAKYKCSDVKYLTTAWLVMRIAMPFIIILFGSLDFIKAVMASDEKKMKESRGKFVKRMIAFFLAIFVPFVVQFIFQAMGTYGSQNMCLVSCIVTNNTSDKGCD
ncbi:MAG: hypothetical protein IKN74_05555 [Clostridia bacterium]|nr:hypothetical protein [Clostridia bacterium]